MKNDERPAHLRPVITDAERHARLQSIPEDVRMQAANIQALARRACNVLNASSAHPAVMQRAKDDLVALSKESLALWSIV